MKLHSRLLTAAFFTVIICASAVYAQERKTTYFDIQNATNTQLLIGQRPAPLLIRIISPNADTSLPKKITVIWNTPVGRTRIVNLLLRGTDTARFVPPVPKFDGIYSAYIYAQGSELCTNIFFQANNPESSTTGADNPWRISFINNEKQQIVSGKAFLPIDVSVASPPHISRGTLIFTWLKPDGSVIVSEQPFNASQSVYRFLPPPAPDIGAYTLTVQIAGTSAAITAECIVSAKTWLVLLFVGLTGGLALFLYGMELTSGGLRKIAGDRLRTIIEKFTHNPLTGLGVGIGATLCTQSSSATAVMAVSFANAGLMTLRESIGILLGAGIGTTITVQLIAFRIFDYSLLIVAAGLAVMTVAKQPSIKNIGQIIFGFGLIFFGMQIMSEYLSPLRSNAFFQNLLLRLSASQTLGFLVGLIFTAAIQSSGATIGILISFAYRGLLPVETALPIIIGANLGTCITAVFSSIGANAVARRVAWGQVFTKLIGAALFMALLLIPAADSALVAGLKFVGGDAARQMANAHTFYNIILAIILLPLSGPIARLMERIIPGAGEAQEFHPLYIKQEALDRPEDALALAQQEVVYEGRILYSMIDDAMSCFMTPGELRIESLKLTDDKIDLLNYKIKEYLIELTEHRLKKKQGRRATMLILISEDFESMGDIIAKEITAIALKYLQNKENFSHEGFDEQKRMANYILTAQTHALDAVENNDPATAQHIITNKSDIIKEYDEFRKQHLKRLASGQQTVQETSNLHLDLIDKWRRLYSYLDQIAATYCTTMRRLK